MFPRKSVPRPAPMRMPASQVVIQQQSFGEIVGQSMRVNAKKEILKLGLATAAVVRNGLAVSECARPLY